jgi:hypothetical protein
MEEVYITTATSKIKEVKFTLERLIHWHPGKLASNLPSPILFF